MRAAPEISRRALLAGVAGSWAGAALAGPALAQQEQPAGDFEMHERYDSAARSVAMPKSSTPTFSPYTIQATENAIQQYGQLQQQGGWQSLSGKGRLKLGDESQDVQSLRRRLVTTGDLSPSLADSAIYDSYVEGGVRRFQARHGILESGVVGDTTRAAMAIPVDVRLNQLQMNLVRIRAMGGGTLPQRYIFLNIPATDIQAVQGGQVVQHHLATPGRPDRQSPVMSTVVQNINFNPYWTVPESIIRKDLIPRMRQYPNYLADKHIRIYGPDGTELQSSQVDWTTDEAVKLRFRQDPGMFNSLGQVRINIANQYGVYMHDTPEKNIFGQEYRFDSSGCCRVQNVRDLVTWIMQGTEYGDRDRVDEVIRSGARTDVQPVQKVPVFWTYVTAWATPEGMVQFRDDIYNKDGYQNLAVVTKEEG